VYAENHLLVVFETFGDLDLAAVDDEEALGGVVLADNEAPGAITFFRGYGRDLAQIVI